MHGDQSTLLIGHCARAAARRRARPHRSRRRRGRGDATLPPPMMLLLLLLLLLPVVLGARSALPLFTVDVDWPTFLGDQDMVFDWQRNSSSASGWASAERSSSLPTSWLEGPALGNGLLGSVAYFCNPPPREHNRTDGQSSWQHGRGGYCEPGNATADAEFRLELGRMDLYSARKPITNFWNGVRLPVGYLRITTAGKLLGGSMRLRLHDAVVEANLTTTSGEVGIRHFVHATDPVHVVEVSPSRNETVSVAFVPLAKCVDRWDVANLINCTMHPNPEATCSGGIEGDDGLSCHQLMGFNGTILAEDGSFATHVKVARLGRGSGSGGSGAGMTVLMTTQSSMFPNNISSDPVTTAATVLAKYEHNLPTMAASHLQWWHEWWPASFLSLPDAPAEAFYWLQMAQIGFGMRANGPVRDEIGPWYVDTEWPTLWLDLNLELTYWPVAPSNRLQAGYSLANGLRRNIENGHLMRNARRDPRLAHVTDAMSLGASSNQMQLGGDSGDLMWITQDVWQLCEYEYSTSCFIEHLLPPLRGAVGWYRHSLAYNLNGSATPGTLHLFPTDSPAGYPGTDCTHPNHSCAFGEGWDASYDIGLARWGFKTLVELCRAIASRTPPLFSSLPTGAPLPKECDVYQNGEAARILRDLAPVPLDSSGINVWRDVPFAIPFRHFSHLLAFMPLQLFSMDGDEQEQEICVRTLDTFYGVTWNITGRGFAASTFSWPAVAQMSAYVGRGEAAFGNITGMFSHSYGSITPTAMDNEGSSAIGAGSDVVNIDPCAVAAGADAYHKLMLQSYHGVLRIFPAVPQTWEAASFHRLRAQRGFEVTAVRAEGATQWVAVRSMAGAPVLVIQADFRNQTDVAAGTFPSVMLRTDATSSVGERGQGAVPLQLTLAANCSRAFRPAVRGGTCRYTLSETLPANSTVLLYPERNRGQQFTVRRVHAPPEAKPETRVLNAWGWHDGWGYHG
jgi:alpha-L-fucosidase 2